MSIKGPERRLHYWVLVNMSNQYWTGSGWSREISKACVYSRIKKSISELRNIRGIKDKGVYKAVEVDRVGGKYQKAYGGIVLTIREEYR